MVRAKMKLIEIHELSGYSPGTKRLKFSVDYHAEEIPEDVKFQKYTPSADATFLIDNPLALAQFELGKSYYVDFSPVPEITKS